MTSRQRKLSVCLLLLAAALAPKTYAGPPFLTDDPEPVGQGNWEFYAGTQDSKTADDWAGTGPHLELNYGPLPNLQLHLIAPFAYDHPKDAKSHYGYGDTEVGFKFRFLEESKWIPQMAIFPLLEIPTGRASSGLGNGGTQGILPLWLQKKWGTWTVYGGGGYGINSGEGNQDWNFCGAVIQKKITDKVILGAEVYHQSALQIDGRDNTSFNVGTVIDLSEHHHLLFSAGRSIDGPVDFQCYVAYQFTFDNSFFGFGHAPASSSK